MSDQGTTGSTRPALWNGRSIAAPAQYAGQCPTCGQDWKRGDLIRRLSDPFSRYVIWGHDTCERTPGHD